MKKVFSREKMLSSTESESTRRIYASLEWPKKYDGMTRGQAWFAGIRDAVIPDCWMEEREDTNE